MSGRFCPSAAAGIQHPRHSVVSQFVGVGIIVFQNLPAITYKLEMSRQLRTSQKRLINSRGRETKRDVSVACPGCYFWHIGDCR